MYSNMGVMCVQTLCKGMPYMAVRLTEVHVIHSAVYHTTTHVATSLALELCSTHRYPITEYHTEWKDGTI